MSLLWRVAIAIGLREGEVARTGRLFAFIFLLTTAFALSKTAQRGLFLAAYPRARIPDAFIVSAVCLAVASFVVSALAARLGPSRLVLWLLSSNAVLLTLGWLGLVFELPAIPFVIYVLVEVAIGTLLVQAWTTVTEVLTTRSAKRLLPLIGNASGIAWVLGGLGVGSITRWVGAEAMLPAAAVVFLSAAIVVRFIVQRDLAGRMTEGTKATSMWAAARSGLVYVLRMPLLRVLTVTTIIGLLIELVIDFQLLSVVQERYANDSERITTFMGNFFGLTGLLLLLAPLVSGRVLSRFGSARSVLLAPACVLVGSVVFFVSPLFVIMILLRGGHRILKQALSSPARAQMQTTIPGVRRAQAGALVKGVFAPAFYAVGAATLKLVPRDADLRWYSVAAALLAVASIVASIAWLRRAYVSALRRSVDRRRLDLHSPTAGRSSALDREHAMLLAEQAESDDAERVQFALSMLIVGDFEVARRALRRACAHSDPRVQVMAVDGLAEAGEPDDVPTLVTLLRQTEDEAVQRACLHTLTALGTGDERDVVRQFTRHEDAELRALAWGCLMHGSRRRASTEDADAGDPEQALVSMLEAPDVDQRVAAVWVMGEAQLSSPALLAAFAPLLVDGDVRVRRAALTTAGFLDQESLVPAIVAALEDDDTQEQAAEAVARIDDRLVPAVQRALTHASSEAVARALAALAHTAGSNGDALLSTMLGYDDRVVRYRAARSLHARRRFQQWRPPDAEVVRQAVHRELRIGYGYYALLIGIAATDGKPDFDVEPEYRFLAHEIEVRIHQTELRIFSLLILVGHPRSIASAEHKLRNATSAEASRAVELLENALPGDIAAMVVPFIEQQSLRYRAEAITDEMQVPEHYQKDPLAGIMALQDNHLRACALVNYSERMAVEYPADFEKLEGMLPLVDRLVFLRRVPLFAELSGEDVMLVAEIAEPAELLANEVLFRKGDVGDVLYLIVSGQVIIRNGDIEISRLGKGEIVGELAVLDGHPRSADVVGGEDTELLRVTGADLEELMNRRPSISREINRVLARRLRSATEMIGYG